MLLVPFEEALSEDLPGGGLRLGHTEVTPVGSVAGKRGAGHFARRPADDPAQGRLQVWNIEPGSGSRGAGAQGVHHGFLWEQKKSLFSFQHLKVKFSIPNPSLLEE
jgi:hypothetical protein